MTAADPQPDGLDRETVDPTQTNSSAVKLWHCQCDLCTIADQKVLYIDLVGEGDESCLVAHIGAALASAKAFAATLEARLVVTCPKDSKCYDTLKQLGYEQITYVIPIGQAIERLWGTI